MICGNCKRHHASVAEVRSCYKVEPARRGNQVAFGTGVSLKDGYYTVVLEDMSEHRTFRINTQPQDSRFAPGEQVLSLLTGSDNTSDYQGVAFVKADGRVITWKRFRNNGVLAEAIRILVGDPAAAAAGYALESGNCYRCGRKLTEPESIRLGIGPVCRNVA